MAGDNLCLAEWHRTFTHEGLLMTTTYKVAQTYCGLDKGHEGKHKGVIGGISGPKNISAIVEW